MNKVKRILALIGAILLVCMYAATLLLAVFGNENTQGWLMASLVMTVIIPVLLYAMRLFARIFSGKSSKEAFDKSEKEAEKASRPSSSGSGDKGKSKG